VRLAEAVDGPGLRLAFAPLVVSTMGASVAGLQGAILLAALVTYIEQIKRARAVLVTPHGP
jgi:hypothetical protein